MFASTIPNGRIVKVEASGKVVTFAELPAKHLWGLVYDAAQGALFAATGPEGKLFRVDAAGKSQLYFDSEEPHLTALALGPDRALYVGSSGQALLYRITGPGRAAVMYDLPGEEVRALAVAAGGVVYAASNEYGDLPELQKRAGGQNPASPVGAARPKPGKGTLTRVSPDGKPEKLLHRDDTHFVSLALGDDGRAYVGTGAEGRVYAVDDAHTSALVADTDERQVGVLALSGTRRYLATSDPPAFHEIRAVGGPDATWTSKSLDAGIRAQFGRIRFRTSGVVELSARTGNTKTPDATWSTWSTPTTEPADLHLTPSRFVQVRARFARDPQAVLSSVTLPFVTDNLRPVVTSVDAQPRNAPPAVREGNLVPASGGEPPAHSSNVKLSWRVDNPDGDPLRYRISYRLDQQTVWRELTRPDEIVTRTEYEWDTSTLPEGTYRVRVEASDEMANPPDRVFRHALESPAFVIDNTPPSFRAIQVQGRRIQGTVVDGVGPIARVDVAIDVRPEWHPLYPKDGVFDTAAEDLDFDLAPLVGAGNHMVAVRVFDAAGNFVVRSIDVR